MHEFSVMSQIVESILEEGRRRDATKIQGVVIELGEFTMLGEEQMRFCFDILAKDSIMEGATVEFRKVEGEVECPCGYKGRMSPSSTTPHRTVPVLECPECGGAATVSAGRECIIRDIRMVVPDV